jgi:hypothetical protein
VALVSTITALRRLVVLSCAFAVLFSDSVALSQRSGPATLPSSSQPRTPKASQAKREEVIPPQAASHHFDRVVIIVLENADYERAMQDPNLSALAARGASLTNFHALFHPSYPNYLAMIAGTDFDIRLGGSYQGNEQRNFPDDDLHKTIADRLVAAGLDFKQYAEELPNYRCAWKLIDQRVPGQLGNYTRRHVPFLSFEEVQRKWNDRVIRVDSMNPNNYFARDARKGLVAYSFYTPNMNHDGHDTTVAVASEWVKKFLDETFPENLRKGTLVVITFDESGGNEDNRIMTLFLGDMVKPASQQDAAVLGEFYNHYSVLRTVEDNFGLKPLTANDQAATPITGIWK